MVTHATALTIIKITSHCGAPSVGIMIGSSPWTGARALRSSRASSGARTEKARSYSSLSSPMSPSELLSHDFGEGGRCEIFFSSSSFTLRAGSDATEFWARRCSGSWYFW